MASHVQIPFSARTRAKHNQIESDFPQSGRMGLLNLVCALVAKNYVEWKEVIRELERIGRTTPGYYSGEESESFYIQTAEELI
jgi:hypothetical protein